MYFVNACPHTACMEVILKQTLGMLQRHILDISENINLSLDINLVYNIPSLFWPQPHSIPHSQQKGASSHPREHRKTVLTEAYSISLKQLSKVQRTVIKNTGEHRIIQATSLL